MNHADMRKPEVKIDAVLALVQQDYISTKKKSKRTLDTHIENHLGPALGARSAERLRLADVEDYKAARAAEGASQATINLELSALKRGYSLANERELVSNRPVIKLYPIGKSNRRKGFFEPDEYARLLAVLPPYLKQVLRFGYLSGWRKGEIVGLRWDVNYDEAGKCLRLFDSKSSHGRTLPLVGDLVGLMAEQVQNRVHACPFIFHREGKQILKFVFHDHWHKACVAAGVKRHFHDLRRTVVRNLTRAGVSRTVAKTITGHESDHIFERYDIVDEADIKHGLTQMSNYIAGQAQPSTPNLAAMPVLESRQNRAIITTKSTAITGADGLALSVQPGETLMSTRTRILNLAITLRNIFRKLP